MKSHLRLLMFVGQVVILQQACQDPPLQSPQRQGKILGYHSSTMNLNLNLQRKMDKTNAKDRNMDLAIKYSYQSSVATLSSRR
jgi:hypothetical protein